MIQKSYSESLSNIKKIKDIYRKHLHGNILPLCEKSLEHIYFFVFLWALHLLGRKADITTPTDSHLIPCQAQSINFFCLSHSFPSKMLQKIFSYISRRKDYLLKSCLTNAILSSNRLKNEKFKSLSQSKRNSENI